MGRSLPSLAVSAIALGAAACGPLDGLGAGDWPDRSIAFIGGESEDRVVLASPSAEGVVWPEAIPEGALAQELRWAMGGALLVSRTEDAFYGWDVATDERRDLGAVPYGDARLWDPHPAGGHIALDVTTTAGTTRQRINVLDVQTGEDLGAAVGCAIERFVWAAAPGEAFAVERRCPAGSPSATERGVVHIAGGTATTLAVRSPSVEIDIAASPDGRWLVVVGDDGVERHDLQGGDPVVLEDDERARIAPVWSADSEWLAYNDRSVEEIVLMRPDGSERTTHGPASTWAQFDPLGDLLVVQRPCGGGAELMGIDPETKAEQLVAPCTSLDAPAWSPDGASIVTRAACDADAERVVFYNLEGRRVGRTECERFGVLRWSPDGDAVTMTVALENEPLGVAVVRRDGTFRRLADGHDPRWRG